MLFIHENLNIENLGKQQIFSEKNKKNYSFLMMAQMQCLTMPQILIPVLCHSEIFVLC